ncbi:MAG: Calx-beta domain-containing protein [Thermoguttaceae bacterium]
MSGRRRKSKAAGKPSTFRRLQLERLENRDLLSLVGLSFQASGSSLPVVQTLDNKDPGFATVGTWTLKSRVGYHGNVLVHAKGDGSDTASWPFTVAPGQYAVLATWPKAAKQATNAPFTIFDGSTSLNTAAVNQTLAPNDLKADGATWKNLGGPYTISGNTLVVKLTDQASGTVVADAIRIERIDPPPGLSISDTSVKEKSPKVSAKFTVSLSYPSPYAVSFTYATVAGGTAATSEYVPVKSTRVTIPAGSTQTTVAVTVLGDDMPERDSTFFVQISAPTNATIAGSQATGTILEDYAPRPNLSGWWRGPLTETNPLGTTTYTMTLNITANPKYTPIFTGTIDDGNGNSSTFVGSIDLQDNVVIQVEPQGMFSMFQLTGQLDSKNGMAGSVYIVDEYGGVTTGTFSFTRIPKPTQDTTLRT